MALGFSFNLEDPNGTPAEPPTFRSSVLTWRPGETFRWAEKASRG
jgi:hypothetical protein